MAARKRAGAPAELKLVASQSTAPLARVAAVRRAAHVRPESALSRTRTTRASDGSRKKTRTLAPWLQTATLQAVEAVSRRVHGEKSLAGRGWRCAAPRGRRRRGHADADEGAVGGRRCGVVEGLLRAGVASGGVGARDAGQHVEGLDADVGATGRGGLGGEQGVGDGAHLLPYAPRTRNCRGSGAPAGYICRTRTPRREAARPRASWKASRRSLPQMR